MFERVLSKWYYIFDDSYGLLIESNLHSLQLAHHTTSMLLYAFITRAANPQARIVWHTYSELGRT